MTDMYPPTLRSLIRIELGTTNDAIAACSKAIDILRGPNVEGQVVEDIAQQIERIRTEKGEIRAYLEGLDYRIEELAVGLGRGKPSAKNDFAIAPCFTHEYQKGI